MLTSFENYAIIFAGNETKGGMKIMTTEEREIGKIVAEAIDLLPKLPEETQAYIKGWMAGVVAVAASSESRPAS